MAVIVADDSNFNMLLQENELVVVKYYADWCGNCRLFKPKYKRLSEDERFTKIAFLDVNAEQSPEARKAAKVDNLPYFAVFKKGQLVASSATSKEEVVVNLLEQLN